MRNSQYSYGKMPSKWQPVTTNQVTDVILWADTSNDPFRLPQLDGVDFPHGKTSSTQRQSLQSHCYRLIDSDVLGELKPSMTLVRYPIHISNIISIPLRSHSPCSWFRSSTFRYFSSLQAYSPSVHRGRSPQHLRGFQQNPSKIRPAGAMER